MSGGDVATVPDQCFLTVSMSWWGLWSWLMGRGGRLFWDSLIIICYLCNKMLPAQPQSDQFRDENMNRLPPLYTAGRQESRPAPLTPQHCSNLEYLSKTDTVFIFTLFQTKVSRLCVRLTYRSLELRYFCVFHECFLGCSPCRCKCSEWMVRLGLDVDVG